jgi:hypothetical protein
MNLEVTKVLWSIHSSIESRHSENAEPRLDNKAASGEKKNTRNKTSTGKTGLNPTFTAPADLRGQRANSRLPSGTIASEIIKHLASAAAKSVAAQKPPAKIVSIDALTGRNFEKIRTGVFTFKLKSAVTKSEFPPGLKVSDVESLLRRVSKDGFLKTADSRDGLPIYTFK